MAKTSPTKGQSRRPDGKAHRQEVPFRPTTAQATGKFFQLIWYSAVSAYKGCSLRSRACTCNNIQNLTFPNYYSFVCIFQKCMNRLMKPGIFFSIVATSMISLRFKWVVSPLFYLVLLSTVFEISVIVNVDKK